MSGIKKTIRISEETNVLIKRMSSELNMNEGELIEMAVKNIDCSQLKNDNSDLTTVTKLLRKIAEQNYHELNLLNNLAASLKYESFDDFEASPYSWLRESQRNLANSYLNSQLNKLLEK